MTTVRFVFQPDDQSGPMNVEYAMDTVPRVGDVVVLTEFDDYPREVRHVTWYVSERGVGNPTVSLRGAPSKGGSST